MIDLRNDVIAYIEHEENHPVELARGFSDVAVLHKDDLIFQIRENKSRHEIARVWNANVRFKNGRTSCLSVDKVSVLRTTASVTRSATRNSLFLDGPRIEQTNRMPHIFAYIVRPLEPDAFFGRACFRDFCTSVL